ncbi:MAG: hypothetical protein IJW44_00145 [Clostridia bacterium]|nr:hypothetical protein [Clostridia bacterium]
MSGTESVRIGIIGVGNIGTAHASAIYEGKIPGLCLCALCDKDPARADTLRVEAPGIPV